MNNLPENYTTINLEGATVPFYKFQDNNITYYQFDSSKCSHPEPMINAMTGLKNIQDNEKLIMINSKAPMGLFSKIEDDFDNEVIGLEDGRFKIIFTKKNSGNTDFNDTACNG